jgi:hypothetical protein
LIAAFQSDNSIVNCVRSHPEKPMLAISGIDSTIKLWEPFDETKSNTTVEVRFLKTNVYEKGLFNILHYPFIKEMDFLIHENLTKERNPMFGPNVQAAELMNMLLSQLPPGSQPQCNQQ